MQPLKNIKGLLIDIDGTLMRGNSLLSGVAEFLSFLASREIPYLIVSNNTKSGRTYQQRFAAHGVEIASERFFTCVNTTYTYLTQHPDIRRAYVIGKPDLKEAVRRAGVSLLPDGTGQADAVIVGGDFQLDFEKLKCAVLHLQRCRVLIGSNGDMLIPTEEGLVPEAGMTLAALSAATGVTPVVLGKPESYFFAQALQRLGLDRDGVAMLGDRLDTDIAGANQAGLTSILICTGVDNGQTAREKQIYPGHTVQDLSDLMTRWTLDQ